MSLSRDVDKFLKKQARLNEEREKIIDLFLEQHNKNEVYSIYGYVESSAAPKHADIIKEFIKNYEKNRLSVEDVKSYLTVLKLYKSSMKLPKYDQSSENKENGCAEGNDAY